MAGDDAKCLLTVYLSCICLCYSWAAPTASAVPGKTRQPTLAQPLLPVPMEIARRASESAEFDGVAPIVDSVGAELIRERYPNRSVKIERQVVQDAQDNFVNHGTWKHWDQNGNLIAEGRYVDGQRDGTWLRWYRGQEAKLFTTQPYRKFQGPFVSRVKFVQGSMNGSWTIFDSKQRKISEWQYDNDQRHGTWTWWYPDGRKMQQITYVDGDVDGEWLEWNPDGTLVSREIYQQGRKLARKSDHYTGSVKKSEGMYLLAKKVAQSPDSWWNARLSETTSQGKDEKHGEWTSWYANGQEKMHGWYKHNAQTGKFVWWHSNGQKASDGNFDEGEQIKQWTWWHKNGQKSIQGEYLDGAPTGRWIWWNSDGKVAQRADFSNSKGMVIDLPQPPREAAAPRSPRPRNSYRRAR